MNSRKKEPDLDKRLERLVDLITDLEAEAGLLALERLLDEGIAPKMLLDSCMEGMRRVGMLFEKGTYYIAALIMAGEIMRSANTLLSPHLTPPQEAESRGRILLGTVKGDIHDLGKGLFALLLQSHGIEVVDAGVDVSAETFLKLSQSAKPDIIGMSCVLTACIEQLKQTIAFLEKKLPDPKPHIIVGGTCLDKIVVKHIGAKYWSTDAAAGLRICQKLIGEAADG